MSVIILNVYIYSYAFSKSPLLQPEQVSMAQIQELSRGPVFFFVFFLGQQHLLLCVERWTLVGFVLHSPANAGLEFNQVAQSMYWTVSLRGVFCSIHCPAADIRVAHGVQKLLGG